MTNARRANTSSTQRHEMLVIIQALVFIESNGLMSRETLNQTRRRLQMLFVDESSEVEMLRELLDLIKENQNLRRGFSDIRQIVSRTSRGIQLVDGKLNYLIKYIQDLDASAEELTEFFNPLTRYTTRFRERLQRFDRDLVAYLEIHEERARAAHEFRIAERASRKLRERLSAKMIQFEDHMPDEEAMLREEITYNFDHENAQHRLDTAEKDVIALARQMLTILSDMKALCQMAMNADMRDTVAADRAEDMNVEDVFAALTEALHQHPRVVDIGPFVIDHFRLIQRTYSLLKIDFENFETTVLPMQEHATEYFATKEDDLDTARNNHCLRLCSGLIHYLERIESLLGEMTIKSIPQLSRIMNDEISRKDVAWAYASDALLVARVAAEADLAARNDY